jgi:hypothetical protein
MKEGYSGDFQGKPIYNTYKFREELEGEFNSKILHYLLLMSCNEDIYKLQFNFDGDEVAIKRKDNCFEIEKVYYITIV